MTECQPGTDSQYAADELHRNEANRGLFQGPVQHGLDLRNSTP
jgi:hypothetical protein